MPFLTGSSPRREIRAFLELLVFNPFREATRCFKFSRNSELRIPNSQNDGMIDETGCIPRCRRIVYKFTKNTVKHLTNRGGGLYNRTTNIFGGFLL